MTWVAVLLVGAATFGFRVSMLLLGPDRPIPARIDRALQGVAPAVIAAIVAVELGGRDGDAAIDVPYVLAGVCALTVTRRSGRITHAAFTGMVVIWTAALLGL